MYALAIFALQLEERALRLKSVYTIGWHSFRDTDALFLKTG
jgi:hypothetical protein